ncbi:hypothetical protein BDZ97DRAFT_1929129 [Flammula alnicola]|nr:hypothetical protein BDZ97DRAFT_1929129 [Flammula alnicola]
MLAITPDGGDWAYRGPESGASVQAGYTQPSQSYHDKYGSAAHYQTESMGAKNTFTHHLSMDPHEHTIR